jgi:hypothetical protein
METKKLERASYSRNDLWAWEDLIRFQLNIAERWLKRGDESKDIFSRFFFYFTGLNALYFLWRKIDNLDQTSEGKHIENLLTKFGEQKAREILNKVRTSIDYYCQRRPIQRMDRRTYKRPFEGDIREGHKWQKRIKDQSLSPIERLISLGQILYLVRCNLVHGSKAESGDDREVIQMSIDPLRVFLEEALLWTRQQCSWGR